MKHPFSSQGFNCVRCDTQEASVRCLRIVGHGSLRCSRHGALPRGLIQGRHLGIQFLPNSNISEASPTRLQLSIVKKYRMFRLCIPLLGFFHGLLGTFTRRLFHASGSKESECSTAMQKLIPCKRRFMSISFALLNDTQVQVEAI